LKIDRIAVKNVTCFVIFFLIWSSCRPNIASYSQAVNLFYEQICFWPIIISN